MPRMTFEEWSESTMGIDMIELSMLCPNLPDTKVYICKDSHNCASHGGSLSRDVCRGVYLSHSMSLFGTSGPDGSIQFTCRLKWNRYSVGSTVCELIPFDDYMKMLEEGEQVNETD